MNTRFNFMILLGKSLIPLPCGIVRPKADCEDLRLSMEMPSSNRSITLRFGQLFCTVVRYSANGIMVSVGWLDSLIDPATVI